MLAERNHSWVAHPFFRDNHQMDNPNCRSLRSSQVYFLATAPSFGMFLGLDS